MSNQIQNLNDKNNYAFIDSQNLNLSIREQGWILDFKRFRKYIEYPNYNKAIIVSGDGDFHCLVEYLVKQDKLLKLIAPNWNNYSSLLRKFMSKIVFMNTLKQKLEYRKKGH